MKPIKPGFWLSAMGQLFLTSTALACSCGQASLEEYYSRADNIIVATIEDCLKRDPTNNAVCPFGEFSYHLKEVLKGETPFKTIRTDFEGGCGAVLRVGETHLLFVSNSGKVSGCGNSGSLSGHRANMLKAQRDAIRKYRDGTTEDLSNPWLFHDDGYSCTLNHHFKSTSLRFLYQYNQDAPENPHATEVNVVSDSGPHPKINELFLRITLSNYIATPKYTNLDESFSTIRVGDIEWTLQRETININSPDMNMNLLLKFEVAEHNTTKQILEAMANSKDISVWTPPANNTVPMFTNKVPNLAEQAIYKPAKPTIHLQSRTTHIAEPLAQFQLCIESASNRQQR